VKRSSQTAPATPLAVAGSAPGPRLEDLPMDDRSTAPLPDSTLELQRTGQTTGIGDRMRREAEHEIIETEHPIPVEEMERCLRWPWRSAPVDAAMAAEPADADLPICRALTMNVIAVAPAADESLVRANFERLLHDNPCVAFLLLLDDRAADLQTRFATVIDSAPDERTILLEQVTMAVNQRDRRRIASLLRPVLVHDLPTLAFWVERMPQDPAFLEEIAGLSEGLVFDSALFEDPRADVDRLLELVPTAHDLADLRMKPWRRCLAEAFEHVTWPPLTTVRATITHTGTRGARAGVATLGRWLEQRLDARVQERIVSTQRSPSFEPCSVELRFDDVCIDVHHEWPTPSLRATVTLADQCLLPFTMASRARTRGALLSEAAGLVEARHR
jgi:glucose-6-phosphate dehydrogenase assembly protein OpcA